MNTEFRNWVAGFKYDQIKGSSLINNSINGSLGESMLGLPLIDADLLEENVLKGNELCESANTLPVKKQYKSKIAKKYSYVIETNKTLKKRSEKKCKSFDL